MKLEIIVAIAVRLFAIAVAIYALRNGASLAPYFYAQGWQSESFLYAGVMVVLLIVAFGLWNFPLTVARKIVPPHSSSKSEAVSTSTNQIQIVGFTILGIYLLFFVLSDIVYWVFIWFITQRNPSLSMEITVEQKGAMLSTFIEFIFVVFLLLGTNGISRLLHRIRYGDDP
jgi:hypothetical protein